MNTGTTIAIGVSVTALGVIAVYYYLEKKREKQIADRRQERWHNTIRDIPEMTQMNAFLDQDTDWFIDMMRRNEAWRNAEATNPTFSGNRP